MVFLGNKVFFIDNTLIAGKDFVFLSYFYTLHI